MDSETRHAAVHGVAKSQTWLSNLTELEKKGIQFHFSAGGYPVFPTYTEEAILSSLTILGSLVERYLTIYVGIYFELSIPLV